MQTLITTRPAVVFWVVITILLLLSACGGPSESQLTASDVWARATSASLGMADMGSDQEDMTASDAADNSAAANDRPGGGVSAVYMVIENTGGTDDRLVSAETDAAGIVELHSSAMDDQGVMRMRPLSDGLVIPANGSVVLQPGGYHVMLMDLQRDLMAGETVALTLSFESGKTMTVEADIRTP